MFGAPVDIANQALQFCGARRITTMADASVNAAAVNFCYDQMRRNELRRNTWGFSVRRAVLRPLSLQSQGFVPSSWLIGTTYALGALVSYQLSDQTLIWQSLGAGNIGNLPGEASANWSLYFGSVNYEPYDSTVVYYAGEVSYIPAAYVGGTTYAAGAVVTYSGLPYLSIVGSNIGHTPSTSPTYWTVQAWPLTKSGVSWNVNTQYAAGTFVIYGGGLYYALSVNSGENPATQPTYWAPVIQQGPLAYLSLFPGNSSVPGVDANWLLLAGTLTSLQMLYPYNAGPVNDRASPNVFPLPYGFLKVAPQDPKAGAANYLGASGSDMYKDWVVENGLILSASPEPIQFRFSADVVNVLQFDPMFCLGFAAAIGGAICEEVTQSTGKLGAIRGEYQKAMTEARLVNGIEQGPTEPPTDDYIACRI
jgi:hypothetical protein